MGMNPFHDGYCGWDESIWFKGKIPIRRDPNEMKGGKNELKHPRWVLDHEEN